MSSLTRLLHHLPTSRRFYSSFSSSKPGGGRYFNSSKPPKVVPPTTKNNKVDRSASASQGDTVESIPGSSSPCDNGRPSESAEADISLEPTPISEFSMPRGSAPYAHPVLGDKDFKLHQFFSLHRPLLLLGNPPSIFANAPPSTHIFSSAPPTEGTSHTSSMPLGDLSFEGDSEIDLNLTRAMTMNHLGAAAAWGETLKVLGVDHVEMDSVKRKRRKKMKKHKLKKRRRATRDERRKMG